MNVILKKAGASMLFGLLLTACTNVPQPRVMGEPFSNVAQVKSEKVCATCMATQFKKDDS